MGTLFVTIATMVRAGGTPNLMNVSDSGVSSADNLSNKIPNFTVAAEAGATLTLYGTVCRHALASLGGVEEMFLWCAHWLCGHNVGTAADVVFPKSHIGVLLKQVWRQDRRTQQSAHSGPHLVHAVHAKWDIEVRPVKHDVLEVMLERRLVKETVHECQHARGRLHQQVIVDDKQRCRMLPIKRFF